MRFDVWIKVGEVDGEDENVAKTNAVELLDSLAGSRIGSEVLANADPTVYVKEETLR